MENFETIIAYKLRNEIMSKFYFILLLVSFFTISVMAQDKIIVHGQSPKLYIWHTVVSKENLYSISSAYYVSTAVVAKQNKLKEKSILKPGKKIKIPLNKNNFTQSIKINNSNYIPLYYVVNKKESLSMIAKKNGKLNIDLLKKWNRLNNNKIKPSQKIIIGFLIRKSEQSAIIESDKTNQDFNIKSDNGYDIQEKPKSDIQIVTSKFDTAVVNELMNNSENAEASEDEGFFVDSFPVANKYNQQHTRTGRVATFKSTSGWTDKKYFVLMNDLPIGTIVRITNLDNNRSICAKVIGGLPAIKSNNNLLIRVSSAAAHTLKIIDKMITVTVGFYKKEPN